MNKTELVAKIAEGAGLSKVDAKKALDATLDAKRGARKGINPATKKAITIPAKKVVKFKAGKELAF